MLPYKLPEYESFHATAVPFNSPAAMERWQPPPWCRNSTSSSPLPPQLLPPPPPPPSLPPAVVPPTQPTTEGMTTDHSQVPFYSKEESHGSLHRHQLNLQLTSDTTPPPHGYLEKPTTRKWNDSGEEPLLVSQQSAQHDQQTGLGVDTFWSSTLSKVAAVAAAAMACAAVPQKNSRDGDNNGEFEKSEAKESWSRGHRKMHAKRFVNQSL